MTVFTMIAVIVSVTVIGGVVTTWIKSKEKNQENGNEAADVNARVQALEERVKVLERLATDKRHRLSEEIDAL
ncbi:hypothetical protein [Kordiimonas aquimaris]|uniref:hypothetical protein n=1 Tax=Kordiimonas aquimaris TaxID=707591 RepID=UPI0021D0782F|nr:hypothetical protein [Kordiimonas aquimaris]